MNKLNPWSWWRNLPQERSDNGDPFFSLHWEIDRLFDDVARRLPHSSMRLRDDGVTPSVDISESDDEIKIEADLPGLDEKDVEVVLSDQTLIIKGHKKNEREEKRKDYRLVERSSGSFSRTLALPFAVSPESISADFSKGVLTIRLPKPADVQKKAHKIAIKTA